MARRSDHTREEIAALAIEAGLALIKAEGFSHFSIRKVAAAIGYTVGTLYNVFGSYDDFLLHINARTLDIWYAGMEAAIAGGGENRLQQMAAYYIRFSREYAQEWTALFEHHLDKDRPLPEWYGAKMERFFTLVTLLIMPLIGGDAERARRATHILWSGIHGIAVLSLTGKLSLVEAESPETLAEAFVRDYMAGVLASPLA